MENVESLVQMPDRILLAAFALMFILTACIVLIPVLSLLRGLRRRRLAEAWAAEGPEGWLKVKREFFCRHCGGRGTEPCEYRGGTGGKEESWGGT